jgi:multisubunit Na+/H+ antiporter MnhB subunit
MEMAGLEPWMDGATPVMFLSESSVMSRWLSACMYVCMYVLGTQMTLLASDSPDGQWSAAFNLAATYLYNIHIHVYRPISECRERYISKVCMYLMYLMCLLHTWTSR